MYQITSDLHKVCPVMGILVLEILGEQNFGWKIWSAVIGWDVPPLELSPWTSCPP